MHNSPYPVKGCLKQEKHKAVVSQELITFYISKNIPSTFLISTSILVLLTHSAAKLRRYTYLDAHLLLSQSKDAVGTGYVRVNAEHCLRFYYIVQVLLNQESPSASRLRAFTGY